MSCKIYIENKSIWLNFIRIFVSKLIDSTEKIIFEKMTEMEKSVCAQAVSLNEQVKEKAKIVSTLREAVNVAKKELEEFENDVQQWERIKQDDYKCRDELTKQRQKIRDEKIITQFVDDELKKDLETLLVKVNRYLAFEQEAQKVCNMSDQFFNKISQKWSLHFRTVDYARKILQEKIKTEEEKYNNETEKVTLCIQEARHKAADAYEKKKEEYEHLLVMRQKLDDEIAEKSKKMLTCCEMAFD